MPKPQTFPLLFDEVNQLSIADLKKMKYLKKNVSVKGVIIWKRNGIKTGSLTLETTTLKTRGIATLTYTCSGTDYNYNIKLVTIPSNIGNGLLWYFICPFTNKRCKKLYLIGERFMHRSALPSGMYTTQTHSKKWRTIEKIYGNYFDVDHYYRELYKKHFKKYYNGKPTKRYKKLKEKIKDAERFDAYEIEQLFLMK
ncbi:hypothetical protein [Kordia zhangzhouensis]|uniref:hypothetical protein n=1 Tax=Kordia zhangzhouensis TaxID=1620405 RepID=UPI000629A8B2|nr:hypothetical protein [Kordia zhangzhouensis]